MPLLRIIFTFIATALITGLGYGATAVATLPSSVKRVVILGDSITYAGTYVTYIEAYFRTRHPERNLEFINVGLPSETVSGLSEPDHAKGQFPRPVLKERLQRVLEATRPDYVIACYGMNDGIYLPFAEDRFKAFQVGILELKKSVEQRGSGLLLVTPPNYDAKGDSSNTYNEVLTRYGDWQLEQRKLGWDVVDLNGPMTKELSARRKPNTEFAFAKDGIHPNAEGHWIFAREILRHLGARDIPADSTSVATLGDAFAPPSALIDLVGKRQALLKDAWLNQTGHLRPGMKKSGPQGEVNASAARLKQEIDQLVAKLSRS